MLISCCAKLNIGEQESFSKVTSIVILATFSIKERVMTKIKVWFHGISINLKYNRYQ